MRQGCAVAAFLADAVLFDIDQTISNLNVYYVRYSDDILIVGHEYETGYKILKTMLAEKELILNPKKVETLYKKDSQENTYQACNLVELKVVKNIAGGFQKGESVYVIDSEMALYAEDIGKDGVFIPDKMASEITISGEKETIHTVGCVKKSESRIMLLPEEDNYAKVSDYWKLKHYMKKNNYIK